MQRCSHCALVLSYVKGARAGVLSNGACARGGNSSKANCVQTVQQGWVAGNKVIVADGGRGAEEDWAIWGRPASLTPPRGGQRQACGHRGGLAPASRAKPPRAVEPSFPG
eukprot:4478490-Alexandrium_andersonii.AAC.1